MHLLLFAVSSHRQELLRELKPIQKTCGLEESAIHEVNR